MILLRLHEDSGFIRWSYWGSMKTGFISFTSVMEINKICDDVKMEIKDRKLNNNGQ
jgi:hypothetical protein